MTASRGLKILQQEQMAAGINRASELVEAGHNIKEIAEIMGISPSTARNYVHKSGAMAMRRNETIARVLGAIGITGTPDPLDTED